MPVVFFHGDCPVNLRGTKAFLIQDRPGAGSRSAPPHRVTIGELSKALSLAAADWGIRPSNPCRGIKRNSERQRDRLLSDFELAALGKAMEDAERDHEPIGVPGGGSPGRPARSALSAVLGLEWVDIDLSTGTLRLREAKTGPRTAVTGGPLRQGLSGHTRAPLVLRGSGIGPNGPLNP